ncbi:hypothetical protein ACFPPA_18925 [Rhodanobacter ginsengisoli]|uniref:Uncharacterized protein n=1 Tax=Rhodanobacter ginsengisoli TaxID=418646 RepID=A0ABW0QSS7_9GAMM
MHSTACKDVDQHARLAWHRVREGYKVESLAIGTEKVTPEQLWIRTLDGRMPFGKVTVAIANKHARQLWVMLVHDDTYDADAWLKHPMVQRPAGKHAITVTAMA